MTIRRVQRSDFTSFFEMETRWKDMDAMGHVNNAIFLLLTRPDHQDDQNQT